MGYYFFKLITSTGYYSRRFVNRGNTVCILIEYQPLYFNFEYLTNVLCAAVSCWVHALLAAIAIYSTVLSRLFKVKSSHTWSCDLYTCHRVCSDWTPRENRIWFGIVRAPILSSTSFFTKKFSSSSKHNCKVRSTTNSTCVTEYKYQDKPPEGIVLNVLGFSICFSAILVVAIAIQSSWRRQPDN